MSIFGWIFDVRQGARLGRVIVTTKIRPTKTNVFRECLCDGEKSQLKEAEEATCDFQNKDLHQQTKPGVRVVSS